MSTIPKVVGLRWYEVAWTYFAHSDEWLITGVNELALVSRIVEIERGEWCHDSDVTMAETNVRTRKHWCRVQASDAQDAVTRVHKIHLGMGITENK